MKFWRAVWAIVWKDIRAELRTKDIFSSMFVFALLATIIFNFAFELRVPKMAMVVPGIVWVAITFAGILQDKQEEILDLMVRKKRAVLIDPVETQAELQN